MDGEGLSPSESEPDSASIRGRMAVARRPESMKPVISGEEMGKSTRWTVRGGWGERDPKDRQQVLGDPMRSPEKEVRKDRTTGGGNP